MASRPLPKLRRLPVASSFKDSLRAARSSAMERFASARAAHALSAAAALRLPINVATLALNAGLCMYHLPRATAEFGNEARRVFGATDKSREGFNTLSLNNVEEFQRWATRSLLADLPLLTSGDARV